jgi:hypothetical protein
MIQTAIELGASDELVVTLADAVCVSRKESIRLPAGRLEKLSRGRGWCRQGVGDAATWGEREDGGYRVYTAGRWVVGCSDGFRRKSQETWDVSRITVGSETWTVAV